MTRQVTILVLRRRINQLKRVGPSKFLIADDYFPCPYTSGYLQACKDMEGILQRMEKVTR